MTELYSGTAKYVKRVQIKLKWKSQETNGKLHTIIYKKDFDKLLNLLREAK